MQTGSEVGVHREGNSQEPGKDHFCRQEVVYFLLLIFFKFFPHNLVLHLLKCEQVLHVCSLVRP